MTVVSDICMRYRGLMVATAARVCRDEPEDVAHDLVVDLLERGVSWSGRSALSTWVASAARLRALMAVRARRRRCYHRLRPLSAARNLSARVDPETMLSDRHDFCVALSRVAELSQRQRQVIEASLRDAGDTQIGDQLGISAMAVRSHRCVALSRLSHLMMGTADTGK